MALELIHLALKSSIYNILGGYYVKEQMGHSMRY